MNLDANRIEFDDRSQSFFCEWPRLSSEMLVPNAQAEIDIPPRARKQPKQTRSKILVQSIKEATLIVVDRYGTCDVQASTICEVAGIAMGSLYQYFVNVESIFASLYEDHIKATLAQALEQDYSTKLLAELHTTLRGLDERLGVSYYRQFYSKGLNNLFGVPLHTVTH